MFFYSINSVNLKIMATSAQLYVTKFYLPWPHAVQLCHAQRNFNATKLRLQDISMVSNDARMVCCHNLSGLQAAPQIANNSASIKFGKPSSTFQKKGEKYFLRENILYKGMCVLKTLENLNRFANFQVS